VKLGDIIENEQETGAVPLACVWKRHDGGSER
jgi:hypothetical protein